MIGIIYRKYLKMLEERFGLEMVDELIRSASLPSDGVYSNLKSYGDEEFLHLLHLSSRMTELPEESLLHAFGTYLFGGLRELHPEVIEQYQTPLEMLKNVDDHIHLHVQQIFPGAILPKLRVVFHDKGRMVVLYESDRALFRLAQGLLEGVFAHFNKFAMIRYTLLSEKGEKVQFDIEYDA